MKKINKLVTRSLAMAALGAMTFLADAVEPMRCGRQQCCSQQDQSLLAAEQSILAREDEIQTEETSPTLSPAERATLDFELGYLQIEQESLEAQIARLRNTEHDRCGESSAKHH